MTLSYIFTCCRNRFIQQNVNDFQSRAYQDTYFSTGLIFLVVVFFAAALLSYLSLGYHAYFTSINHLAYQWPDWISQVLTVCGDTGVALMFLFIFARGDQRLIRLSIISAITSALLLHGAKEVFQALRPAAVLAEDTFHLTGHFLKYASFPSGHTGTIFTCMAVLSYKYTVGWQRTLMLVLAILVGLSRVWVGAHWPIDVMVGAGMGILGVLLANLFCQISSWGKQLTAQVVFVGLFLGNNLLMLFFDTGYPKAQYFVIGLAVISLLYTLYHYILLPLLNPR